MAISSYLTPRGKRGIFQLRVAVSARLRPIIGKREFIRSLGTSDRQEAERRAHPILADWNAILAEAERVAANIDPGAIAYETGFETLLLRLDDARRKASPKLDDYQAFIQKREGELLNLVRRRRDGDLGIWEGIADRTIAKRGLPIAKGSDEYQKFVLELADLVIEAVSLDNRRNAGDLDAQPRSDIAREYGRRKTEQAASGETIMEFFEKYASQRLLEKRKRPASIAKDRKIVGNFVEFVGRERSAASITKKDVREWFDLRATMPRGYEKMSRFAGLSLRSASKKVTRDEPVPRVSAKTLNSYLSAISPFFEWLMVRDHHAGPSPCIGISLAAPKGDNPRPPFTTDQLNAILASPLFTGFAKDGSEHEPGNCCTRDWRFWIPLVCLFTGARVSEIAQLRTGDVRQDRGVWLIYIRHDDHAGQSTKSGESRIVPVHSTIERIGFLEYCAERRQDSDLIQPLFPDAEDESSAHAGDRASRFWREYLEDIKVKENRRGGDGFGAHSFRHTIADRFREEAELLDTQIAIALGHTVRTVTSGYGQVKQGTVNMLRGMFDAVTFEGVIFEHLYTDQSSAVALDTAK